MRAFSKDYQPASYRQAIERAAEIQAEDDADEDRE